MKSSFLVLVFLCGFFPWAAGQNPDSADTVKPVFLIGGGLDVYYGFDFSRPSDRNRQFTTQAYQHNEFNLNHGFLQGNYVGQRARATLAIHTGTYVQANYATEPNELTRLIMEASAGIKLAKNTWLDAGILPSHIGYESTFSSGNELYTRALMAEYSPYYEAGAQLSHRFSDKLEVKLLVLNGWQVIHETNRAKSLSSGFYYKPTEKLSCSYTNYFGNQAPDSLSARYRFFNNLNLKYLFNNKFTVGISADYGRQKLIAQSEVGNWYAVMLLAKYQLFKKAFLAGRLEYYHDQKEVIVSTVHAKGFQIYSFTLNYSYEPVPGFLYRIEARSYSAGEAIFIGKDGARKNNLLLVNSLAAKF